jgi:type IV pilus assembly protein PilM
MLDKLWKKTTPMMVGIDIGSHSVKAVLLSGSETAYCLEAYAVEPMPKGAVVDREVQDIEAVGNVIAKVKKSLATSVEHAVAAVSGSTVITKVIYMDIALSEEELAGQIEVEADSHIPYPLDEVSIDFEILETNESDPSKVNVLLSAARTETVAARVSALEAGGFQAKVMDVESYALDRAIDLCLPNLPDDACDKNVAIVDIGATMMLFAVREAGSNTFTRDQLFGGEQYTRSIISYYNKSFEEAEQAKVTGELPPNYTFEVLAPFQTMLLQQVRRVIQMYLTASGKEKIDYLILSGGCALVEGIEQLLTDELGLHTVMANPFSEMELSSNINNEQLSKVAPQLMLSLGLALRSFSSCHI